MKDDRDYSDPGQWTAEELRKVDELYEGTPPPEGLEEATVQRLALEGTIRAGGAPSSDRGEAPRAQTSTARSTRVPPIWIQFAAGLALFFSGYLVGRPASDDDLNEEPFYLLLHQLEDEAELGTPDETRRVDAYRAWMGTAASHGPVDGRRLSLRSELVSPSGGQPLNPGVVGFFEVSAGSWTEALEIARTHPHLTEGGWIEVRRATPTEGGD